MPTQEATTATTTSAAVGDRRRNRRVPLTLEVLVCPADFTSGDIEAVQTTLNVSRGALYFLTSLDRYCRGMRLWVASAQGSLSASGNWKDIGEVARVDSRADGRYGVAVVLSAPSHMATSGHLAQPFGKKGTETRERREVLRYPFVAPAELIDASTGARVLERTSDLCLRGCYVDTLNPFPLGTTLQLKIQNGSQMFEVRATVSSSHPGSGMGLFFGEITPKQSSMLAGWLDECAAPPRLAPATPLQAEKTEYPSGRDHLLAVRLIHSLVRKGILTQSDATALLENSRP